MAPRHQPVAVKVGFMKKRGNLNRNFAKRLFLLDSNGNLVYYAANSRKFKEHGMIPLQVRAVYTHCALSIGKWTAQVSSAASESTPS